MDDHTLGGDLELVRNESEWRDSIAADCGLDPDDPDDPDVFDEAAVDFLMADSLKAADEAGYTRDGANASCTWRAGSTTRTWTAISASP